ncbi:MAG: methyltransferase domain-containing protein [Chitinophagaceae bacterium]|nr:MAG: methyltransferase domain-containing protein [Chitinophagaceae bacterium]
MSRFAIRSYENELLDADDIPFADIQQNMQELNTINTLLGGHGITIKGLKKLAGRSASLSICEIGCGGGDNLRVIHQFCTKNNIRVQLTGIDIKDSCIAFAQEKNTDLPATWICSDYRKAVFPSGQPDIIFSSLFCHHFIEEDLVTMMQWMNSNSIQGFFINDLHRHPLAYYSIKGITQLFSKSYLVKNDAPLSVARGFRKKEWQVIFSKANLSPVDISWQWAFRHLIVYKK